MSKPTVSIGIPAYNEEANIKQLLESLLAQQQDSFELKEIIVVSDGSSDHTVELARSVQDPRVKVIDNHDRKGQAERQNWIAEQFDADILVILNADILPHDELLLEFFVKQFMHDPHTALVGTRGYPVQAKTWFERMINFSVALTDDMTDRWNGGNNIYHCHGHARAFSRAFAKQIRWQRSVGEDAYSYLYAIDHKFVFTYMGSTGVWYRSPQHFKDHMKQSMRFRNSMLVNRKLFPQIDIQDLYRIPKQIFVATAIKYFLRNPLYFIWYGLVQVCGLINPVRVPDTDTWEPSKTSKNL